MGTPSPAASHENTPTGADETTGPLSINRSNRNIISSFLHALISGLAFDIALKMHIPHAIVFNVIAAPRSNTLSIFRLSIGGMKNIVIA